MGRPDRFAVFQAAGPTPPAPGHWTWRDLMSLALEQGIHSASHGDVPVGAVIVAANGEIIAKAGNRVELDSDPTAHAEILALRQAAARTGQGRLAGCVLVATLEPCLMCAGALTLARISGVVFGAADIRAGAIISTADYLALPGETHKIWHMGGILADDCAKALNKFFLGLR